MIKKLLPFEALKSSAHRFPLSCVFALIVFTLTLLGIYDVFDDHGPWLWRLVVSFSFAYFWCGAVKLYQESERKSVLFFGLASLAGISFFALFAYILPDIKFSFFASMGHVFSLLAISLAGFTRARTGDLSYWVFNVKMWLGVFVAIAAGIIWGSGGSLALLAVDKLFDIDVPSKLYQTIWSASLVLLTPIYALSWVPDKYDFEDDECRAPVQLNFLVNWVLGPLSCVYLLILYAYFIKILVEGALPSGILSVLTMGFSGVTLLTYLISFGMRKDANAIIRFLQKYLFIVLIIPAVMQGWALHIRVESYGVTEERYLVGLSAVYILILCGCYIFSLLKRRVMSVRVLPMTLAMIVVLVSVGPFSLVDVSERSQFSILKGLLVKNGILVNGRIVKTESDVSFEDSAEISSRLSYFSRRDHIDALHEWFDFQERVHYRYFNVADAAKQMGIEYLSRYDIRKGKRKFKQFSFYADHADAIVKTNGFDYVLNTTYKTRSKDKAWDHEWNIGEEPKLYRVLSNFDGQNFVIGLNGSVVTRFDVEPYVMGLLNQGYRALPEDGAGEGNRFSTVYQSDEIRVMVEYTNVNGTFNDEDGALKITMVKARVYIDLLD